MKTSTGLLFAAAAVGAATAVVLVTLRKRTTAAELGEVPRIIDDCFERVQQLQRDLQQLKHAAEPTS